MTPDRIKEELQWLRAMFPVIVALEAGLIAYIVQPTTSHTMALLAGGAAITDGFLLIAVVTNVYRFLKRLE